MNWYYVDGGQQTGPVDEAQLEELARAGKIQPETLVWREGMTSWLPYRDAQPRPMQMASAPGAAPLEANEAVCSQCGKVFSQQELITYEGAQVCAGCKPVFLQKVAEGVRVARPGALVYAGFWIRFVAKLIDGLILGAVFLAPIFYFAYKSAAGGGAPSTRFQILQMVFQLLYMLANMAYTIFFLGKFGATPGKMALKLQVVTAEGEKITYLRATGRFFAEMLSGITCYIGYIIAGFDDQKRALHDHICNTRVVYRQQ